MATRLDLRASIRKVLANETTWPDGSLNTWIADAIGDYSKYFPYYLTEELTGDQFTGRVFSFATYGATMWQMEIYRVEYPAYEDPPHYLAKLSESHPDFYGGDFFDWRPGNPPSIILGKDPADSEYILLYIQRNHTTPGDDITVLSVPSAHFDALRLFVFWQACLQAEATQAAAPDATSDILTLLGLNAERARQAYEQRIEQLRKTIVGGGVSGPWEMDENDRIY